MLWWIARSRAEWQRLNCETLREFAPWAFSSSRKRGDKQLRPQSEITKVISKVVWSSDVACTSCQDVSAYTLACIKHRDLLFAKARPLPSRPQHCCSNSSRRNRVSIHKTQTWGWGGHAHSTRPCIKPWLSVPGLSFADSCCFSCLFFSYPVSPLFWCLFSSFFFTLLSPFSSVHIDFR